MRLALAFALLMLAPSAASAQIVTHVDAVSAIVPVEEEDRLLYEHVLVTRMQAAMCYVTAIVLGAGGIPLVVAAVIESASTDDHDFLVPVLIAFGSLMAGAALIDLVIGIAFDAISSSAFAEWRRTLGLAVAVGARPGGAVVSLSGSL